MGRPGPTLADVAARAKVSVSTASLAFSGAGPIADRTRARVLAAAAELDYAGPNPLGRQLRSGRSGIVGVVVGDWLRRSFRDPVSVQVLDALVTSLGALGVGVLLIPSAETDDGTLLVDPLLETAAMDVAVLFWGAFDDDPRLETLRRRGIPAVIAEGPAIPGYPGVEVDDVPGVAQAVDDLRRLGHRRFATITLPFGTDRRSGWVDAERLSRVQWAPARRRLGALLDSGVDVVGIYETEASLVENGRAAALEILDPARSPGLPTAIVAQSDLLAAGAVLAARELGLRVPQDLSIVGFDGLDIPWLAPDRLTTTRQPLAERGAALARAAEAVLADGTVERVLLPVEQVRGSTTGPPSA
ncbi:MAG: LacI family DNA-binding transcriptional regulator [Cellulomonadaceae bacterium]